MTIPKWVIDIILVSIGLLIIYAATFDSSKLVKETNMKVDDERYRKFNFKVENIDILLYVAFIGSIFFLNYSILETFYYVIALSVLKSFSLATVKMNFPD